MIVESHRHIIADCQHCSRVGVPCVEFSASERDEGLGRSVVSMRLDLRVVIGVECLRGMLVPRSSTARTRWDGSQWPSAALPVVPVTCGECDGCEPHPHGRTGVGVCTRLERTILDEDAGALLDAQSGVRTSGSRAEGVRKGLGYHGAEGDGGPSIESSSGGASRFFKQAEFGEVDRFKYCPKASRSEREAGLDHLPPRVVDPSRDPDAAGTKHGRSGAAGGSERRNHHATVKPIELMRWLVRLVTPPGGIVLEPFAGSGTTLVACALEGRDAIGMELDPEYVTIGRARVAHARATVEAERVAAEKAEAWKQEELWGGAL